VIEAPKTSKTLGALFWVVLSRWYVPVIAVVVFVVGALGYDSSLPKQYTATSTMQLLSQQIASYLGGPTELQPADIATDVVLVQSTQIAARASKILGQVAPKVTVTQIGTTNALAVSVTSHDPVLAARAANAYVQSYISFTKARFNKQITKQIAIVRSEIALTQANIQTTEAAISAKASKSYAAQLISQLNSDQYQVATAVSEVTALQLDLVQVPNGATVNTAATTPASPSSPKPLLDGAIALVLALALGIGLILLLDLLDDRIRSRRGLLDVLGEVPIFAEIPRFDQWNSSGNKIYVVEFPHGAPTEAYRSLRTAIQFIGFESDDAKVILFTSPLQGEGKTTTVIDIAAVMASAGRKVLVLGCDLRKPSVHQYFETSNVVGVSTLLAGTSTFDESIVASPSIANLSLISAGPVPPNPSELLESARFAEIVRQARAQFDVILIDSPPVLPVTDSLTLAKESDFVTLVVRAEQTPTKAVRRALELLRSVNAKVGGVVLNATPPPSKLASASAGYGYGYDYGYGYGTYGVESPRN